MKWISIFVALMVGLATGCSTVKSLGHSGTTRIDVSGEHGVVVTGFYVQKGRRVAISNSVPWQVEVPGLSSLEIRKQRREQSFIVKLSYDSMFSHAKITKGVAPGKPGIRVEVKNGFRVDSL
jgi:hypothetical protein